MDSAKISKTRAGMVAKEKTKKNKIEEEADGQANEKKCKKARSKYFTVVETDLLLTLVMESDLSIRSWEDITRIFNASAGVNVSSKL